MPKADPVAAALVKAALDLHARQLWLDVPVNAMFLVRLPGQQFPLVASIMGHAGGQHGLFVVRGERAFEAVLRLAESGGSDSTITSDASALSVTVERFGDIQPVLRGLTRDAGLQLRRDALAPWAIAKTSADRPARPASRSEQKVLLAAVRAVLAAHDAQAFHPLPLDERQRRILEITVEEPSLPSAVARVQTRLVPWPAAAPSRPSLPPSFAELPDDAEPPGALPSGSLPDTLQGWKHADQAATERLVQAVTRSGLDPRRMERLYFGDDALAADVFAQCKALGPEAALIEWIAADWRATPKAKTILERLLESPSLPAPVRAVLQARRDARLSVYRVDACRPGEGLEVEDVLSGEASFVHDRGLASSGLSGFYIPLRLQRVGRWDFPALAGPPLSGFDIDRALAFLEALGADLSPGALRRTAHLTGRLWEFAVPSRKRPPILTNTDGDLYEFHTATFRVGKPEALVRALGARKDLVEDAPGDWSWLRQGGPAKGLGENTILARLQLLGDHLVVEVNSGKRLARARRWIERLPDVRFEQATIRAVDAERPRDDTLPSPPDEPLPPDVLAKTREMHDEMLRQWLDTSIPMLGDQTPREACRTLEGRQRVARLIRTMPPAMLTGGTTPDPRESLMRELGLEPFGSRGMKRE
ncbi:MAG TPA: MbcA/ParS/Xre antitoxin family protein [Planctomycetota bacterium]|nr:MbcA/ParS/Xre antitoxin family protein [Planctomycetota bacterium]